MNISNRPIYNVFESHLILGYFKYTEYLNCIWYSKTVVDIWQCLVIDQFSVFELADAVPPTQHLTCLVRMQRQRLYYTIRQDTILPGYYLVGEYIDSVLSRVTAVSNQTDELQEPYSRNLCSWHMEVCNVRISIYSCSETQHISYCYRAGMHMSSCVTSIIKFLLVGM